MKTVYSIILILFLCLHCEAQTWNLIWSDEFNGTGIDAANWTYDIGGSGWGNSELEYYTNRAENAKVENGQLLIIARKESYSGNSYTSSRLKTQNLQNFTYGKIEARIKIPVGQGLWPAFWMLGQNIIQAGWPQCGEVDIMEHVNEENKNYGTMHWDNNGHSSYGGNVFCDESTFHTYSIEWDAHAITWFLDGNKYWEGNITNDTNSTEEFHLPFFLILNLAVGGVWPGNPDATTPFPDTMYVDYVRAYQFAADAVDNGQNQVPNNFSLLQNYPNPFNSTTIIQFNVPTTVHIKLVLFDMLGRQVKVLVDEERLAGSYREEFDASRLPSGVYFYQLQTETFTETKKLILLR